MINLIHSPQRADIEAEYIVNNDILTVKMIAKQYKLSEKTVYRYINRGMKASQGTTKGYHFAVRKDVEDFLKRDQYDVYK